VLEVVSVNNAGQDLVGSADASGVSATPPGLSADGQIVAFAATVCNAGVPSRQCGDSSVDRVGDVYVRDRTAGTTQLGSITPDGLPAAGADASFALTDDARYLLFEAPPMNGTPGCTAGLYVRDLVAGTTAVVDSLPTDCAGADITTLGNQSISGDGSIVAFTSLMTAEHVSATNPQTVYIDRLR